MASFGLGGSNNNSNPPQTNADASTPFLAASEGNLRLLQSSLQHLSQPPTIQDDNGYTLLMAAASYNHISILQWLLETINDDQCLMSFLHTQDQEGDTVLHYAGSTDTAKWLLQLPQSSPLLQTANRQGKTPLQAKQEELDEMMQDEDVEEDDEDVETLKLLVEYLTSMSR
jgi:ankyrin repeat protein